MTDTTAFPDAGARSRRQTGPLARFATKWIFRIADGIHRGRLTLSLPSGECRVFAGSEPGPEAALHIHDWRGLRRTLFGGDVGFAEGYLAGEWSTDDLTQLLELCAVNYETVESRVEGTALKRLIDRLQHTRRANTRRGAKRNIQAHYDLGNSFYRQWLDPTMTYSSALFERPNDPLEIAQQRKYARIAERIAPSADSHILEIGCGWGGFATYAAKTYGCKVTGITLSQEQYDYASERAQREGLADRIEIRIQDYRDVEGRFDGIASIEMFEAVGETHWPRFFSTLAELLKDEGRAALQVITIDERRFEGYRKSADFIQRYVFPGGMLPSPTVFKEQAAATGLSVEEEHFFGSCYARTLAEWQRRFQDAWPGIEGEGFDQRFRRLWDYYLAYCRAGFQTGGIDVGHFVLARR